MPALIVMKYLNKLDLYLFAFAAFWSIGASLYLLLSPVTIYGITATSTTNGSDAAEEFTRQVSWYAVQGMWGVIVLVVFALLFSIVAFLAFKRMYLALAAASILAVVLTFLAGFSIGPIYLPAVLGLLLAWIVLGIARVFRGGQSASG